MGQCHPRLHILLSETKVYLIYDDKNVNISVELSHLTLLIFTDYFCHIIKKKIGC
jgi:hypothetical protein